MYYLNGSHYDDLYQQEFDDMKYHGKSSDCNDYDKYILNYGDHYEVLEEMETFHQQLNYQMNYVFLDVFQC